MRAVKILFFTFLVIPLMAEGPHDCSVLKSNMKLLCGDSMVENCSLIADCFKRRDSCGVGIPQSSDSCTELDKCSHALSNQYSDHFTIKKACRYEWKYEGDKSSCRVSRGIFWPKDDCPGLVSFFTATLHGLGSAVDREFNCAHLEHKYKNLIKTCNNIRKKFKNNCMIESSREDQEAYEQSFFPVCEYYNNFKEYFHSRTMVLDVEVESVNNEKRQGGKRLSTETGDNNTSSGARER